jgi:hypothetical protein
MRSNAERADRKRQEAMKELEQAQKRVRVCEEAIASLDRAVQPETPAQVPLGQSPWFPRLVPVGHGGFSPAGHGFIGGPHDLDPLNPFITRPTWSPGALDTPLPRGSVPVGARFEAFNPLPQPRPRNPDDPGFPSL